PGHRRERSPQLELHGRADGIADRQSQQATAGSRSVRPFQRTHSSSQTTRFRQPRTLRSLSKPNLSYSRCASSLSELTVRLTFLVVGAENIQSRPAASSAAPMPRRRAEGSVPRKSTYPDSASILQKWYPSN